jgi:alkanesulfonate monooxygenase SsuD/methylene tetrahydromethanopterin reductase-like flavin-dependent oxidoreductase (luciferase family)
MPRPKRRDLPITIGGKGPNRTQGLVVKHAAEWNTPGMPLEEFQALNARLTRRLKKAGRDPRSVRRSLMTSPIYARNEAELRDRLAGRDADALRAHGRIIGTAPQIADQLRALSAAGLDRVMLRWENLDDAEGLRAFGRALLPLMT